MAWRVAKSLEKLRSQINAEYPKRDKSSDGTIGDAKHASRSSDHNPWVKDGSMGVVTGMDITNDPKAGPVSNTLAETLKASRDPRIKYIISNARICSGDGGTSPWVWRKYTGANAHRHHVHISVKSEKKLYDSAKPWTIVEKKKAKPVEPVATIDEHPPATLTAVRGDSEIWNIQRRLKAMKYNPGGLDGIWGGMTAGAITGFINDRESNIKPPTSADAFSDILDALKAEISAAEGESFTRPIAPERAEATPAEIGEKLPEVKASIEAERLGFWASIAAGIASVVTGISKFLGDTVELLNPLKEFVGDMPWQFWIGGAMILSFALYYISRKSGDAKNAATQAYQEGARV